MSLRNRRFILRRHPAIMPFNEYNISGRRYNISNNTLIHTVPVYYEKSKEEVSKIYELMDGAKGFFEVEKVKKSERYSKVGGWVKLQLGFFV